MKCFICNKDMADFFIKESYSLKNILPSIKNVTPVQFLQCPECGFVVSETHTRLASESWAELNAEFHHALEKQDNLSVKNNQPPYLEQAMMLALLAANNIIDISNTLDYAAGYGTLHHILSEYFNIEIKCYDKYINSEKNIYIKTPEKKSYSTVINSAMFEHITSRSDLDDLFELVADEGCLFIHTLIPENVPQDPDWFYLDIPVHTATHTNKSMQRLMQQWGFRSSLYSPKSKAWVLLKQSYCQIKPAIERINKEMQTEWLIGQDGFVDYWK